jgi:uncharacterized protein (TIGR02118 family)
MARMVVIYKMPENPAAFDQHYFDVHVPMAKKLPGLRKYEVSRGDIVEVRRGEIVTRMGPPDTHRIGTLLFDDMAAIERAFGSPEGRACALDVRTLAPGGDYQMFLFDDREV